MNADAVSTNLRIEPGSREFALRVSLQIPVQQVKNAVLARLTKHVAKQPGFRKGAKMIPPALRKHEHYARNDFLCARMNDALARHPDLATKRIFVDHDGWSTILNGRDYIVKGEIECAPDIKLPFLESLELLLPKPQITTTEFDRLLADLPVQHPNWIATQRAAGSGDRLIVAPLKYPERKIELAIGKDDFSQRLIGLSAGGEFDLPLAAAAGERTQRRMRVLAVEEAQQPDLNLKFAQRLLPDSTDMADFKMKFRQISEQQLEQDAYLQGIRRAEHLLVTNTPSFPLPTNLLARFSAQLADQGQGQAAKDSVQSKASAQLRAQLIIDSFVRTNNLEPSSAEMQEALTRFATANKTTLASVPANAQRDLHQRLLRHKIFELIKNRVPSRSQDMTLTEFRSIASGHDPCLDEEPAAAQSKLILPGEENFNRA